MTSLAHIGQLAPSTQNYAWEYLKLKDWALQKYGKHEWQALDNSDLPRIGRRDAIRIATWWAEVTQDLRRGDPTGDAGFRGFVKMELAAYGSPDAAKHKAPPTGPALDGELNVAEAMYFWDGMRAVAHALPSARRHPSLLDRGELTSIAPGAAQRNPDDASYWELFGLARSLERSTNENTRRAEERTKHTDALGRILASEAGSASRELKRVVGWIARNRSVLLKRPMFDMAAPQGRFGPIAEKRPMSSAKRATAETRAIAAEVLAAPRSYDPTQGATHGFDTALQNDLAARGTVTNDADAVIAIWETHYRLKRVGTVGTWVLYRGPSPITAELMASRKGNSR
jgi:hypothetical protein